MVQVHRCVKVGLADSGERLEKSKVIMRNWLVHLRHLGGELSPVSLLMVLSGLPQRRLKVCTL